MLSHALLLASIIVASCADTIVVRLYGMKAADWSRFMGISCPQTLEKFTFTEIDRSDVSVSIFYAPNLYLDLQSLPKQRPPDKQWMLISQESPVNIVNYQSIFTSFRHQFTSTSTYRSNADVTWYYGGCKKRKSTEIDRDVDFAAGKQFLAVWSVSNCRSRSQREMVAHKLVNSLGKERLHIYGKCGWSEHNCKRGDSCETRLISDYKFMLSFENSLCIDYITEKSFRPLLEKLDIVPVIMAMADVDVILPPHSYIDVRDFRTVNDLANYLNYLDNNDTAYNEYFAWRKDYTCGGMVGECKIGTWLLEHRAQKPQPLDLSNVFSANRDCKKYATFMKSKRGPKISVLKSDSASLRRDAEATNIDRKTLKTYNYSFYASISLLCFLVMYSLCKRVYRFKRF